MIKLDISQTACGVDIAEIDALKNAAVESNKLLHNGQGAGNDFLGWVNLPSSITEAELAAVKAAAKGLASRAEVVIVIGIGGSYLGAKAVLEALTDSFHYLHKKRENPYVIFAGQNISETYTYELLDALKEYSIAAVVISKSGTTTEPAIAFRIIKAEIEKHGLKLFGVLPHDDAVYRCDCDGEPSAKLPDSDPMKTALKGIMQSIGL